MKLQLRSSHTCQIIFIVVYLWTMCKRFWCIFKGALHSLEDMKQPSGRQSLVDRIHRGRSTQAHTRSRPIPVDKRVSLSNMQN